MIIYQHVAKLESESNGARALTNAECPQCKSTGRVPIHHGLRDKECLDAAHDGGSSKLTRTTNLLSPAGYAAALAKVFIGPFSGFLPGSTLVE